MPYQLVLKPSKLNTQVKPANCSDRPRPTPDTAVKHIRQMNWNLYKLSDNTFLSSFNISIKIITNDRRNSKGD